MKKIFTLVLALMGFAAATNAATVDDLAVLKHSYVLVCDQLGARPGKGVLFGNDHFLDVTGGSVATNKGSVDLSVVNEADDNHVTQEIVEKYGADYAGSHYNWLRLKNNQDVIAMKLTAKSKVIMFVQGNNKTGKDARIPCIAKSVDDIKNKTGLNAAPTEDHPTTDAGFRWEYTVDDDGLYYFGSYNGDMFVSFIIIEANEAPGTPTVKVGDQTFEGGLWFREVSCKANPATEEGSTEKIPTVVTYTTDGTMPTATSPVYTEPIKCYKDMTVKFQAFLDFGDHTPSADFICDGADNEGNVNFTFGAPSITVDGANVTITSPYAEQNGTNFYSLNGGEAAKGDAVTLSESATVVAYTEIANGDYAKFTSMSSSKDAYVLNAIKEKKTIAITSADVVEDAEATAASTTGPVYKVENGAISTEKMDFFVKNLEFGVVKDAAYQIDGKEAYIKMNNTNITFKVAAGDVVKVKVVTSKNSCKTLNPDNDETVTTDRKCYVNVSGTNYGSDDVTAENGNIIEFELKGGKTTTQNVKDAEGNDVLGEDGKALTEEIFTPADTYYTFQKYSGTGNILIASIEIEPAAAEPAGPQVIWENNGSNGDVSWNGIYRFGLEGNDGNNECIATFSQDIWNKIKTETFCMEYRPTDPTNYMIRVTTGWWSVQWLGQDNDIAPWKNAERIIDNGDGTFHIEINFGNDPILEQLDAQHLLFTGAGYTPLKLYFASATGIQAVKAAVKAENNVIYNLAGQRVDANYKGMVIKNGQKMIQK